MVIKLRSDVVTSGSVWSVQIEVEPLGPPEKAAGAGGEADHDAAGCDATDERKAVLQKAISRAVAAFHALHMRQPESLRAQACRAYVQGAATGRRIPLCASCVPYNPQHINT
jgi:hypothetical protein